MADRLPRMPLGVGGYVASTAHLTLEGHAVYLLLQIHYWSNEGLPNDDVQLAAIARLSLKRWRAIRPAMAAFFGPDWTSHAFLDAERTRILRLQMQKRDAG